MVQTTSNDSLRGAHAESLYSQARSLDPRVIEGPSANCPRSTPRGVLPLNITCGPLLRYVGMNDLAPNTWRGSIMIVTRDDSSDYSRDPVLALACATGQDAPKLAEVPAKAIHKEQGVTFWRFDLSVAMAEVQQSVSYMINSDETGRYTFYVPAADETMNVMFYSCNGFSYGVDPSEFQGRMWNDVLKHHGERPFHVMLGGGDQIYCDAIKAVSPTVKKWSTEKNPITKHGMEFTEEVEKEIDSFYLWHYIQWYGFGYWEGAHGSTRQVDLPSAMAQIPMINVFDDHDIIDGFGSYHDHTMRVPIFNGIGNCAFKYYLLFQHQLSLTESLAAEPAYVVGTKPGPYIRQQPRSVYARLGKSMAFYGLDCRTERSHEEIVTPGHYKQMFDRLRQEVADSQSQIRHLLLMLGVPIAYPRMVWLENILTSRVMEPVKVLAKHGPFRGLMNDFDGSIEILDDLDDHWCAKHHKKERNWLVEELLAFARDTKVRVTILSGDVHLAAIGRFYTKNRLPAEQDPNMMLNIISSAIVNSPPSNKLADFLNKRNKIHHLTHEIDEDMVKIFTHDVDGTKRNNMRLLPRRNWCSIAQQADSAQNSARRAGPMFGTTGANHIDNEDEPTYADAADSLSIVLHMEKDQHVESGETMPYRILVPALS
ncbi:hypothetical protein TRVA0_026S01596 [Trichomonascus vanleenenianus]|uniref:uncharacterized protein n=1 Tax=Trichomonascus vanleenenianus TaxID=2268995 RepID=UPI003EC9C9AD